MRKRQRIHQAKLTPYENWEDTGWARSLLALCGRLKKGEEACRHLLEMQRCLTGPNLLVMHPPTRGTGTETAVYELDGNTGFSMAVMEMLVQTTMAAYSCFPHCRGQEGRLKGAVARGGITLDMEWNQSVLKTEAVSEQDRKIVFRFGNQEIRRNLKAGQKTQIVFANVGAGKDG